MKIKQDVKIMSSLYELKGDWLKLQDMFESEDFDKLLLNVWNMKLKLSKI